MQAVVTGSAGFIGRHLVDELIARGYRVTGIDRQPRPNEPDYEHHTLDLADEVACGGVAGGLQRADIVVHLAARPGVRGRGPVIEALRRGLPIQILGEVTRWRDTTDVRDAVEGLIQHPVSVYEADATLADTRVCRELLGFVPTTDVPGLLARQLEAANRSDVLVTA